MSSRTKKAPIDPESTKRVKSELTTDDMYRELDSYLRARKQEDNIKKRRLADKIVNEGEQLMQEIQEKNIAVEEERLTMIEYIFTNSQEKFVELKELKQMEYGEVKKLHAKVTEWKKPAWRKFLNMFR